MTPTDSPQPDSERERFMAWFGHRFFRTDFTRNAVGQYEDATTEIAWQAFDAARTPPVQPEAVGEITEHHRANGQFVKSVCAIHVELPVGTPLFTASPDRVRREALDAVLWIVDDAIRHMPPPHDLTEFGQGRMSGLEEARTAILATKGQS